jgi:hypothetical protein
MIVDDLLDRFEFIPPPSDKRSFLCQLSKNRQAEKEKESLIKTGIETALFIAPLAIGPWGRIGLLSLEGSLGIKLLKWGLSANDIQKAAWLSRASIGLVSGTIQYDELEKIENKCKKIEQKYMLNPQSNDIKI